MAWTQGDIPAQDGRVAVVTGGVIGQNPAMGALSQLRAATDPAARGGEFYGPRFVSRGYPVRSLATPRARDARAARELRARSADMTGVSYNLGT
jgi:hypothetical protein